MGSIRFKDGKVLFDGNSIAMDSDCCCQEFDCNECNHCEDAPGGGFVECPTECNTPSSIEAVVAGVTACPCCNDGAESFSVTVKFNGTYCLDLSAELGAADNDNCAGLSIDDTGYDINGFNENDCVDPEPALSEDDCEVTINITYVNLSGTYGWFVVIRGDSSRCTGSSDLFFCGFTEATCDQENVVVQNELIEGECSVCDTIGNAEERCDDLGGATTGGGIANTSYISGYGGTVTITPCCAL